MAAIVSSTIDKKHPDAKDVLAKSEKEELAVDKVDEELLRAGSSCCFLLGDSGWFFCFGGPFSSFGDKVPRMQQAANQAPIH